MFALAATALVATGCTLGDAVPAPPSLTGAGATEAARMEARARPHYDQGKQHLAEGRLGHALEAFRTAVRLDSGSVDALNGLAVTFDHMGRHADARRFYLAALELSPSDPITLNNLGWSNMLEGRTALARVYLAQAAALAPDNPVLGNNAAYAQAAPPTPPQVAQHPDDLAPQGEVKVAMSATQAARLARTGPASFHLGEDAPVPGPPPTAAVPVAAVDGPAASCAGAMPAVPLHLVNGTGRNGQAARLRGWISGGSLAAPIRLANADGWGHERSTLSFPAGMREQAQAIRRALPFPVRLEERAAGGPIRLLLGRDSLPADDALRRQGDPCRPITA